MSSEFKVPLAYPAKVGGGGEGVRPEFYMAGGLFNVVDIIDHKPKGSVIVSMGTPLCGICLNGVSKAYDDLDIWFNYRPYSSLSSGVRDPKCKKCGRSTLHTFEGASEKYTNNQYFLSSLE